MVKALIVVVFRNTDCFSYSLYAAKVTVRLL